MSQLRISRFVLGIAAIAFVLFGGHAYALSFTTANWAGQSFPGPNPPPAGAPHASYPGDHVAFLGDTDSLALGGQLVQIGQIDWDIDWTYNGTDGSLANDSPGGGDWPPLQFLFDVPIDISFDDGGPIGGGQVLLPGDLDATWDNDYLTFSNGVQQTFNVGSYIIDVTPLAISTVEGSNFSGDPAWQQPYIAVWAQINVSEAPVVLPEPASMTIVGLGLLGLAGMRRLRRKA